MLGKLEISKARDEAQQTMGQRFDIKSFHDRVLEDGAVPVSFLHEKITRLGRRNDPPHAVRRRARDRWPRAAPLVAGAARQPPAPPASRPSTCRRRRSPSCRRR